MSRRCFSLTSPVSSIGRAQHRNNSAPFIIGVYGPNPFGDALNQAVAGEKKNNRPLQVRNYASLNELHAHPCEILFISAEAMHDWGKIRKQLDHLPVLTVSDTQGFPEQGGMVNLLKIKEKIQVEINRKATLKAGLTVSSKLLSLARIIK